jgi:hypothetical protein
MRIPPACQLHLGCASSEPTRRGGPPGPRFLTFVRNDKYCGRRQVCTRVAARRPLHEIALPCNLVTPVGVAHAAAHPLC